MTERSYLPLSEFDNGRDELLTRAGIPAEVVASMGEDTVVALEGQAGAIDWLELLAKSDNPFSVEKPCDFDLSYLEPAQAAIFKTPRRLNPEAKNAKAMSADKKREIMVRHFRALEESCSYVEEVYGHVETAPDRLLEAQAAIDDTLFSHMGSAEVLDLPEVATYAELLLAEAQALPGTSTLETLINVREFMLRGYKRLGGLGRPMLVKIGLPFVRPKVEGRIERAFLNPVHNAYRLNEQLKTTRKRGKDEYEKLRGIAHKEAVMRSLYLSADIVSVKEELESKEKEANAEEFAAILAAEAYLVEMARRADQVIRTDKETMAQPNVRQTLQQATDPALNNTHAIRRHEQALSKVEGFRPAVRDARQILAGGRRLHSKDPQATALMADTLRTMKTDIRSDQLVFADRTESGVVVAIVHDKFEAFWSLHSLVHNDSELASGLEHLSSEVISKLRRLDLDSVMAQINQRVYDHNLLQEFDAILGQDGLAKVMAALYEYSQAPAEAEVSAA